MWILVLLQTCLKFLNPFTLSFEFNLQLVDSLFHLEKPGEDFVLGETVLVHQSHPEAMTSGPRG